MTGTLPPRPGDAPIVMGNDKILIVLEGEQVEMEPSQALSFAGTIIATVECYMRSKEILNGERRTIN